MIFGATALQRAAGATPYYDTFSGEALNTELWDSETYYVSNDYAEANIVDGRLKFSLYAPESDNSEAACGVRVTSTATIPTTGTVTIKAIVKVGKKYLNAWHMFYMAAVPASPSRVTSYGEPYACPMLKLGAYADWDSFTEVHLGKSNSTGGFSPKTTAAFSGALWTDYALEWIINWTAGTMDLKMDGATIISGASMSYTPSGDHYLDIGLTGRYRKVSAHDRSAYVDNVQIITG